MSFQTIDTKLLLVVNRNLANNIFDIIMPFLSAQGYLLVIPFFLFLFMIAPMRRDGQNRSYLAVALWTFVICFCAVVIAEWLEYLLKAWIGRVRPCRTIEGVRLIVPCPQSPSLPSGHATSSFSVAAPLYYLTRQYLPWLLRLAPLVLAGLIAFSRIYLGVHYPSDVAAGALLGAGIGLLLALLYEGGASKVRKI